MAMTMQWKIIKDALIGSGVIFCVVAANRALTLVLTAIGIDVGGYIPLDADRMVVTAFVVTISALATQLTLSAIMDLVRSVIGMMRALRADLATSVRRTSVPRRVGRRPMVTHPSRRIWPRPQMTPRRSRYSASNTEKPREETAIVEALETKALAYDRNYPSWPALRLPSAEETRQSL